MDIKTFSNELLKRMKSRLAQANLSSDELIDLGPTLSFIRDTICELKTFTRSYTFKDSKEEIHFFKEVKPIFLSHFYYHKKIFALRLFDSFKDPKSRQANYDKVLQQLERYALKNKDLYEYLLTNGTYLDEHYFTRGKRSIKSLNDDETFSTDYDDKIARMLANDLIKDSIQELIKKCHESQSHHSPTLVWTGSKTDLIELIYALHASNVFNDGTADIRALATTFQDIFNVSLGNYYRTFQDIRIRKSGQANFLDQMRTRFMHRINEIS